MKARRFEYAFVEQSVFISIAMLAFGLPLRSDSFEEALIQLRGYEYGMAETWRSPLNETVARLGEDVELRLQVEKRLMEFVHSDAPPAAKWSLVRAVAMILSDRSVREIMELLNDSDTFDLGLYMLDASGVGSVDQFGDAWEWANEYQKVALINLLGKRRMAEAFPLLSRITTVGPESSVGAAIWALGELGTRDAAAHLATLSVEPGRFDPVRVAQARIRCADGLMNSGFYGESQSTFEDLITFEWDWVTQVGAYRGLFLLSENPVPFLSQAISSAPVALRSHVIRFCADLPKDFAKGRLFVELDGLNQAERIQLLDLFSKRGDTSIRSFAMQLVESDDVSVARSMIEVLGRVGGAEEVEKLLEMMASGGSAERKSIRTALYRMPGSAVDNRILELMRVVESGEKIELLKAIAERNMTRAAEMLIELAFEVEGEVLESLVETLGAIASLDELEGVIRLYEHFEDSNTRRAVVKSLRLIAARQAELSKMTVAIQGIVESLEVDGETRSMLESLLAALRS